MYSMLVYLLCIHYCMAAFDSFYIKIFESILFYTHTHTRVSKDCFDSKMHIHCMHVDKQDDDDVPTPSY